jgi:hypothetical protein
VENDSQITIHRTYVILILNYTKKLKPQRHRDLKEFIEITHPFGSWRMENIEHIMRIAKEETPLPL